MSKKASIIIFGVLGAVIIALGVLLAATTASNSRTILGLGAINDDLEYQKSILASQKDSLEAQVADLQKKLDNAGELYADEIDTLKLEIEDKLEQIAALEADIAKYQTVFTIDVRAQAQLIEQIEEYISTQCPFVKLKASTKGTSEDDSAEEYTWVRVADLIAEEKNRRAALGDEAEPLYTDEELSKSGKTAAELTELKLREIVFSREDVVYPSVSVYYEDLATGYHYGYNEDARYESASVIKAPYIFSILREIAAQEKAYLDAKTAAGEAPELADTDGDGVPDTILYEYSDPIYNLSDTIIYERQTMLQSGSGEIKNLPDGTELSYIDLIKYTLEYSDNIGFAQLKKRFGYNRYYTLLRDVKANNTLNNAKYMTAAGTGKLFKAMWEFIDEDETYGKLMYDSMLKANHTVIIPYGVSPTKALHKYGWDVDSYHDAAIVLHPDKPYVLTVFTDLDNGGNEVNAYLQNIVKMINKLHKGYYQS